MEWSEETSLSFISEYKKRPLLWDLSHPYHYNKMKRREAINEISAIFGRPPAELRKKWENLTASFRRERTKLIKVENGKDADSYDYTGSWYAFEAMRFTLERNKPKSVLNTFEEGSWKNELQHDVEENYEETIDPLHVSDNETDKIIDPEQIADLTNEPDAATTKLSRALGKKSLGKAGKHEMTAKQMRLTEEKGLDKELDIFNQSTSSQPQQDSADIFGKLVASKLKRFDSCTRSCLEIKILQVLLEAEMGNFSANGENYYGMYPLPIEANYSKH